MIQTIADYWLNFLLTAISGGLIFACKRLWGLYKKEKDHQEDEDRMAFRKELETTINKIGAITKEEDRNLQSQINIVKSGILSIQRKTFMQECKSLLQDSHEITLEEFEAIQEDHRIYNSLGGNSQGDALFAMVQEKAMNNLTD